MELMGHETAMRYRLAETVRQTVADKTMTAKEWASLFRAAPGPVIPVMRMPDGMAEKVLDRYEAQTAQKKRLN